jgi:sulfur carrier protein
MEPVQPGAILAVGGAAMTVTVNGDQRELPDGATVDELVAATTVLVSGVAAAVNGDVVPRGSWAATVLRDGDHIEVVTAVQGG